MMCLASYFQILVPSLKARSVAYRIWEQTIQKWKKLAHNNFKLDETGGEFSKRVENTVEKGEIAL